MSLFPAESYSRSEVAKWAGMEASQLEYLIKQGVLVPDVGKSRKKFSRDAATLAVIAAALLHHVQRPAILKEPLDYVKDYMTWPDVNLPRDIMEIGPFVIHERNRHSLASGSYDPTYHVSRSVIDLFPYRYPHLGFTGNRYFHTTRLAEMRKAGKVNVDAMLEAVRAEVHLELEKPATLTERQWLKCHNALLFRRAMGGAGKMFLMFSVGPDSYWFKLSAGVGVTDDEDLPSSVLTVLDVGRLFSMRATAMGSRV